MGWGDYTFFLWVKGNVEEIILSSISSNISNINDCFVYVFLNEYEH